MSVVMRCKDGGESMGLTIYSVHFHLTAETPTPSQNLLGTRPSKELAATVLWCGGVKFPFPVTGLIQQNRGESSCTASIGGSGNSELSLLPDLCILLCMLAEAFKFPHILLLLILCSMKSTLTALLQTRALQPPKSPLLLEHCMYISLSSFCVPLQSWTGQELYVMWDWILFSILKFLCWSLQLILMWRWGYCSCFI